ncbi:MAG: sialidase family protein [Verrucomicrobia bacterium]|nr:sialidase family protein [Verrucomicrobiota bacterium]
MNPYLSSTMTRRHFLQTAGVATASVFFTMRRASAAPAINVIETKVISQQPEYYCGWPTVARRRNGDLLVSWSGGREAHVCPFGRVEMMVSHDNGATWGWPQVLLDGPIDDRDSGVVETAKGSILVTTFTSLAYEPYLEKQAAFDKLSSKGWTTARMAPERLARWKACHERLNDAQRKAELGQWMIRSTDGGVTWSARYSSIVNSPHGPVQLSDGRLLYAGKELWTGKKRTGVCESRDDGKTWRWLAEIPVRDGDEAKNYHELHAVEVSRGRVIVQIRNHNKANAGETLQTESSDGGKKWSTPRPIGVWGLPSHLLRLRSGKLLMTYGHRRPPFGNQARVSDDGGKTWSEPVIISGDGLGGDLGYPSTVELGDGTLLSVWYEVMKGSPHAVLRQAKWKLET